MLGLRREVKHIHFPVSYTHSASFCEFLILLLRKITPVFKTFGSCVRNLREHLASIHLFTSLPTMLRDFDCTSINVILFYFKYILSIKEEEAEEAVLFYFKYYNLIQ